MIFCNMFKVAEGRNITHKWNLKDWPSKDLKYFIPVVQKVIFLIFRKGISGTEYISNMPSTTGCPTKKFQIEFF